MAGPSAREKSGEAGEELVSLLIDLEDCRDASGQPSAPPKPAANGRAAGGGAAKQPRDSGGGERVRDDANDLSGGEDEDEEHLNTVDFSYARLQGRAYSSGLRRSTRDWWAPLRVLYHLYDAVQSWLVLTLVGVTGGVVVSFVDIGADWATDLKFGRCTRGWWISRDTCCSDSTDMLGCPMWHPFLGSGDDFPSMCTYTLAGTSMAVLAAWLTRVFAPYAAGSGIPEIKVILGGSNIKGFLGARTLLIKSVGLVLSVGSGLSVGKEGPAIHVCTCIGSIWCRYFPKFKHNQVRRREVLSCAAGAGMAVAFGAPIGGVLFSLEEASSYFPPKTMWRAFFCAIAAVMTIQWLHRYPGNGKLVLFEVTFHHQWKFFEMPAFALLGAAGGLLGAAFIRLNVAITRIRKGTRLSDHPVLEALTLGLVTCLLNWHNPVLRGSATGLLAALFSECRGDAGSNVCAGGGGAGGISHALLLATGVKFVLTALTATSGVPGGTLIPSLAIGGLMGRAAGLGMESLQHAHGEEGLFADCGRATHCVTPGVYAMVGAAAVLGGVTRMTVSLVVIMFELTGGLEYMLPVMVAVMVSKWAGDACGKDSMYDQLVALKGYPYLDTKADLFHTGLKAEDVMTAAPLDTVALEGNTPRSIDAMLKCSAFRGFPVVTTMTEMFVVGYICRRDLVRLRRDSADPDAPIELTDGMDTAPLQISPTTSLDRVWEMFSLLGLRYVVVCRRGRLVGIIKKKDLLAHQNHARQGGTGPRLR